MKKLITTILLTMTLLFSSSAFAIDPKIKILGTMAGYGVVGGALLGAASMAFDAGPRSISRGASLGLYAGLLFGSYVILSYELKKRGYGTEQQREDYYPDSRSPYEDRSTNQIINIKDFKLAGAESKKDPKKDPIVEYSFVVLTF